MSSKKNIKFKCPYCDKRFTREELVRHIDDFHEEMIPEGYSSFRLVFNYVNKKPMEYNGKCTECGGPTRWDENKGRYDRQCNKPSCRSSYLKKFENNMLRTKGVTRISSTAEGQAKMLANRKISGTYKFQNGVEKTYTGSYELKALEFMDKVLNINPDDISCPGPILEYTYKDKKHLYITDFYYIPYNLVIEVKDGGKNPNKRDMPDYRGKQIAKEEYIIKNTNYNYLRLTDNDLSQLLAVFMDLKMQMVENNCNRVIHVNEDYVFESIKNNKKLYTISENNLDGKTLIPRVPENFLTKNGYEDNKTKRVCFSTSIGKCLTALSQNCTNKEFFVHIPDPSKKYDIYKPTKDEVPDVIITDEHWILNSVNLICIGKIICTGDDGKDGKKYTYGDGKFAELYGWKYNWLEKYIEESNDILSESLIKNDKYQIVVENSEILESNDILTENLIFNKKDICKDLEKFESGKSNVLLITGFSGSGKSTLAKELSNKYKCDYFELDSLDFYLGKKMSLEDAENGEPALASFIKHKQLKQEIPKENYSKLYEEYLKYVVNWCKRKKPERFIIEGLQIYEIFDDKNPQSFITSNPIIIKGTSGLFSAIRGAKRNNSSKDQTTFFKELKGLLGWVIKDNKQLKKLEKNINEAMNALMTGYIPGVDSEGSVYVVNYMQNNVFSGEEERGYGISDNPKLTNLICRNKEGILTKAPSDLLEKCKYDVYMVNIDKDELSKKIYPYMEKFVSESFIYECIFGKKMYTYDQIMTEESAIPVIDYYKGLDLLGEMVHNFIMGKSNNDEYIVMNENSIMSLDYSPESKDKACITYTSLVNGKYRVESAEYPELALESNTPLDNNSVESKFIKLLTSFRRE